MKRETPRRRDRRPPASRDDRPQLPESDLAQPRPPPPRPPCPAPPPAARRPRPRRACYPRRVKVIRWGDHLVQLQRVGGVFPISCYLVRDDDGFTLLDTAISGSADGILAAARDLGAPIRRIALTHPHVDLAGALDALHARLPDAEILIGARDARVLRGARSLLPTEPQPRVKGGWSRLSTHP